ncbi:MAG: undecaprenyl-diphosphate phosphatase [Clostridia bacterium]|nr:undecaprenyl-diphosphate phosphatase [Clostridia bacterium]
MSFWILCLLCVVQGLTEFLPVSSSGHLLLIEQIFGIENNLLLLNLFLHIATLVAVVFVFRKKVWELIKKPLQPLTYKLVLSTVFTVALALCYELFDLEKYVNGYYGFCFLITAILLLVTFLHEKHMKNTQKISINAKNITIKDSIFVGIVQGFAVLPGISRSGSTISTMMLLGKDEDTSAEYSFLLSIPVIIGGFVFELVKVLKTGSAPTFNGTNILMYIFAFVLTFIVALISLKLTLKLLKKNKFVYFSIYLFALAVAVIIFNFIH